MSNKKNIVIQEDVVQAVLIADNFEDEFVPITNDIPLVSAYILVKVKITLKYIIPVIDTIS